jgi:hypothetical protein
LKRLYTTFPVLELLHADSSTHGVSFVQPLIVSTGGDFFVAGCILDFKRCALPQAALAVTRERHGKKGCGEGSCLGA